MMRPASFGVQRAPEVARRHGYRQPVLAPDPLIVSWQGREVRVRHDDPHLVLDTPRGAVIRSAVELASDVDGLRLVLASTLGDRYRVKVSDDGSTIGLWRPP
jgi:hypothetical protein